MKKQRYGLNKSMLIVIYYVLMFVFPVLLQNILMCYSLPLVAVGSITNLCVYVLLFVSAAVLLKSEFELDFKILRISDAKRVIKAVLLGLMYTYCANLLGSLVSQILGRSDGPLNQQMVENMIKSKYVVFIFLVTVIFGPFVEEAVFRKALPSLFRKWKFKPWLTVTASSVLFALMHVVVGGDVVNIFPYLFMGIVLGITEEKTKNIFPGIFIHMLFNYISFFTVLMM